MVGNDCHLVRLCSHLGDTLLEVSVRELQKESTEGERSPLKVRGQTIESSNPMEWGVLCAQ